MNCPSEYKGVKRKKWARLFDNYRPPSAMYEDMAKRYFIWDEVFESESKTVLKKGGSIAYKNGTGGQSPAFQNMKQAEGEMRRLLAQMEKHFVQPSETSNLGDFAAL